MERVITDLLERGERHARRAQWHRAARSRGEHGEHTGVALTKLYKLLTAGRRVPTLGREIRAPRRNRRADAAAW
jgi:hypothetical protein